ncbi:MAG TPA: cysteine peptidase family C39 domain-containing protein [Bryobacteraceae bacterium]|nr:cysteine peptidase family C39 domain-containing protein [Bryobacteraceae bacterium]
MRLFVPEVVQTSNMDCGPASLKSLLDGWGIPVSYGRLREACQTGIDGTSIDTMESVANQLGLQAEQIMIPADHLFLPAAQALPAIVVVTLPNGLTHFVVVWRRHGNFVQVMDPAVGRRWVPCAQFLREVYLHSMPASATGWREFAGTGEFQTVLAERLRSAGISRADTSRLITQASQDTTWRSLGTLDAATRMLAALARAGGLARGPQRTQVLERLCERAELIPAIYWSVQQLEDEAEGEAQLAMRGAILVRVRGKRARVEHEMLSPELRTAISEKPLRPGRELIRLLAQSGSLAPAIVAVSLFGAAAGVFVEALLFRGLFDITGSLGLAGQRMGAMAAVLIFSLALVLIDGPLFSATVRLGRHLENRLRIAFFEKIPKLGDRYFQSRLTSDMAERSHATRRLRDLPENARQLLRITLELSATAAGIMWLEPSAAPLVLLIAAAALVPVFTTQSVLAEQDLRVRSHSAGLTRFYLDAMLGLLAIRAHGAEKSVRREHEKLLGEWAHAALRLQRTAVSVEALQLVAMFGLVACLLLIHPLQGFQIGRTLLLVYWALNLPVLGQEAATLARQFPFYRNIALRLLDPLGAPEEPAARAESYESHRRTDAPAIALRQVSVVVSGHTVLEDVNVELAPGSQVAIVGQSGAGKSSLAGLLLGWHKPSSGAVLVDSEPVDCEALRHSTAWVDPAVQLWNRSLFANVSYGSQAGASAVGEAIDAALLRNVLESLPDGLQTKLGEGGALVSGGEGQRVRLARALLRDKVRLAILDEPFRGLDREKRRQLLARSRNFWRGCTLLCITHDLEETQEFDRVLVMEYGRVVEDGAPRDLAGNPDSRYAQLLAAERRTRAELWSANIWRHIRIHSGRLVEEMPKPASETLPASEVA